MLNQFSRTELIFGHEGMERLYNARVAIFGIGGVGGYTAEALARSGVGELDLIDDDRVCLTNLNRQIFATRKTVGKFKVDVAEERILEINPKAVVHTYKTFYYLLHGSGQQGGSHCLPSGGHLQDLCLSPGQSHAPGAEKAGHQTPQGGLFRGAAPDPH